MATAEELLTSSIESESETNELIINLETREITIPKSISNLGVESDDDVRTLHFKMDRYYDGVDLTNFDIRINYLNALGGGDIYNVETSTTSDDSIQFDWLVGRFALIYKGKVKFNVCMRLLDTDGVTSKREFNTAIASIDVLEGLEVSEQIVEKYGDLLAEWEARLFGVSGTVESDIKDICETYKAEIEAKGVSTLATIPDDYTTVSNTASQALRTRAVAIVESVEGTAISVSDTSDDYLRGLRVFGKTTQISTTGAQLFDSSVAFNNNNLNSIEITDDGYTITGVGGATYGYTFARYPLNIESVAGQMICMKVESITSTYDEVAIKLYTYTDGVSTSLLTLTSTTLSQTVEVPTDIDECYVYVYANISGTVLDADDTCVIKGLLVTYDENATWEPYTGGIASPTPEYPQNMNSLEEPVLDIYGKNLARRSSSYSYTTHGVSFVVESNSSECTINGTAESDFSNVLMLTETLPAGTYTLSVQGLNVNNTTHDRIYARRTDDDEVVVNYVKNDAPQTFELEKAGSLLINMVFKEDSVYENRVVKVQLEVGSEATDYEPYCPIQSVALSQTLPGIPVATGGNYTDENGQQWICDEVDFGRGVYVQRIKQATVEFNGSGTLTNGLFYAYTSTSDKVNSANVGILSTVASVVKTYSTYDTNMCYENTANVVFIGTATDTLDTITAKFGGSTLLYILATPIETALTETELLAFASAHSNCPNTVVLNDAGANMLLEYNADTQTYILNKLAELEAKLTT